MSLKLKEAESRIKVQEMPPVPRSGGETRAYDYPHLYQIQAGEWRISYAVEQNHLAILVLEVLNPDGTVKKDPGREDLTRKMKIKLLDWPEGSPSRDLPPEDLGKKVKIRLLDLAEALHDDEMPNGRHGARVRFVDAVSVTPGPRKVTLLDGAPTGSRGKASQRREADDDEPGDRKVTPLDSPSM